jgi:hypothetical protein
MIDKNIFFFLRDKARDDLEPKVAAESFGYYIDIPDQWENFKSPKHLIHYLGIHYTHVAQYGEICKDIGEISSDEISRAKAQLDITRTTGDYLFSDDEQLPSHGIRFDLAETLYDWRTILKFKPDFEFVIDYGAGSGRQSSQAFCINKKCKYVGIDATLAAYTVQNIFYNTVKSYFGNIKFHDLLDYEYINKQYPDLSLIDPGTIIHFPAWNKHELLPAKQADLILACHVHNELSGSDFLRLMNVVKKCLSEEGIFYVRSELGIWQSKNYFDTVDFHAIDPVLELDKEGIVPIHYNFEASFMTTIFARKDSNIHKKFISTNSPKINLQTNIKKLVKTAFANKEKVFSLIKNKKAVGLAKQMLKQSVSPAEQKKLNSHDIAFECADKMLKRITEDYSKKDKKVLFIKNNFPNYDIEFENIFNNSKKSAVYQEAEIYKDGIFKDEFIKEASEFNPEIIIISSQNFNKVKKDIIELFKINYYTKIHYTFPVYIIDRHDYRISENDWFNLCS